jgi:hypothetical protein
MATTPGTLATLARVIDGVLRPLAFGLEPGNVQAFFGRLGYPMTGPEADVLRAASGGLSGALAELGKLATELATAAEAGDDAALDAKGLEATARIAQAFAGFADLKSAISGLGLAGVAAADIAELPERLLATLMAENFESMPPINDVLELLGLLDRTEHNFGSTDPANPEYTVAKFHFDRLFAWVRKPGEQLSSLYGWGAPGFDGSLLLPKLERLISRTGMPVIYDPATKRLDLVLADVTAPPALVPPGVEVDLKTQFNAGAVTIPTGDVTFEGELGFNAPPGLGITIQPGGKIGLKPPDPAIPIQGSISLGLAATDGPYVLISEPGGSRIEIGGFEAHAGSRLTWSAGRADGTFDLSAKVLEGKVNIDASKGDGFLTYLVPGDGVQGNFSFGLGFASDRGFFIEGSATIEIRLPMHVSLGPISFDALTIAAGLNPDAITASVGADIGAKLGPLQAVVENMGVKLTFEAPPGGGNLGPVGVTLGFKPPRGVGLSIDAGVVKGGGYLFLDFEREEYGGAIELVFAEFLSLKSVGLITTRMPDGSKGFSLLVIITAEFGSGIQLGFGFNLIGVGGILGLNRVVAIEALSSGIRSGGIESVMFPKDVVANAPRIISDLRQYFPPQRDVFLIGPMAKLGWGTPTLVSGQLGLILEFPNVNITILGLLKVVLPHEDADLLHLQVNFIGRIEPANSRLWFYAELYDSRLLFLTLEGGFGLLLDWGDESNFVLSAGGFHPRFTPPPLPFPEPTRLAISILNESFAKIRVESYFAVTSNSVQFGAHSEMFFGIDDFSIEGHLTFDALFQFDPFYFRFALSTSFSVKVFGVGIYSVGYSGLLEGPTPWHIEGKGHISLLFFSISVPFQHTWGSNQNTRLDPIEVMLLADSEFKALSNWEAKIPVASNLNVSLRNFDETETDRLVLHPLGRLRISERKVPINFKLDKVGNKKPKDVNRLKVSATLSGSTGLSVEAVKDRFAIGQFRNLDASAQLSSPAFEPLDSGIEVGVAGAALKTSQAVRRVIRYETIIIDNNFKRHVKRFFGFLSHGYAALNELLFSHFLTGTAVTKSPRSQHQKKRLQPFEEVITIEPNLYSIVSAADNQPASSTTFSSKAEAEQHLEDQVHSGAAKAGARHVLPNSELRMAV